MYRLASLLIVAAVWFAPAPCDADTLDDVPPPAPGSLTEIPQPLRVLLQQRVIAQANARQDRVQRLVEMIFADDGMALQYDTTATHSVTETFATRRANCLSFTLLFVTLAREAGINARAQEVGRVLSWFEAGGIAYNVGHVNALIRIDGRSGSVDLDSNILMDRGGPRQISDARLLAHFYNNRGAELMSDGRLRSARDHLQRALQLDETLVEALNNLGVLAAREGDLAAAQRHYAAALLRDANHATALSNSVNLYRRLGDDARVQRLLTRLQRVRASDPFHHYLIGSEAERRGEHAAAMRAYARAIRLYPDAHQFHFGLARVAFLAGDSRRAERALRAAHDLAPASEQARYQAKLTRLQQYRRTGTRIAQP